MPNIQVTLRIRPLSQRELDGNYPVVIAVENNSAFITDIRVPERSSADSRPRFRQFNFDHVFWFRSNTESTLNEEGQSHNSYVGSTRKVSSKNCSASQSEVYMKIGPSLETAILGGYNACLLAYGQTNSGKTYTMIGSREDLGIIPRFCQSLWDKLKTTHPTQPNGKPGFRLEVSFLEIYREKVKDLLNPEKILKLREHPQLGPHVQGLTRVEVTGEASLLDLLWDGERRRALGNTTSNRCSSRSHAIWTLYLTVFTYAATSTDNEVSKNESSSGSCSKNKDNNGNYPGTNNAGREDRMKKIITSQVHLVDLAGSEKANCTSARSLLAEGADINKSLVALGNVISALAEKAQYVPYRDSTLTWLLKDSIGGNASTSIIITASPSSHCHTQSLNSFRFAQRARLVETTPKINSSPLNSTGQYGPYGFLSVMSVMELKKDISRLARIIKSAHSNGGILRGLVPRSGWTRLIHAIEGIGKVEKEQGNNSKSQQDQSSSSEETGATSGSAETSSASPSTSSPGERRPSNDSSSSGTNTLTAAKSLNDVMIQADIESRDHRRQSLHRRASRQSESALQTSNSNSTKIVGTEVFIPTNNSYKCLTWQQEETHPVPKPANSSSTSSLASVSSDDDSGKNTPLNASNTQIHHLKYMLKVEYPVSKPLDHASRISEKIHGVIVDEHYQRKTELHPEQVDRPIIMNSTVQEQIPTLVHPQELNVICEEVIESGGDASQTHSQSIKGMQVLVGRRAKESKDYLFPTKCKHFASAVTPSGITPFESSDENEFFDPVECYEESGYRTVYPEEISKRTLSQDDEDCTFDEMCYLTAAETSLSQVPTLTISSSSSYESVMMPDTVRPVNLVREFSETNEIEEDFMEEFTIENEVFRDDFVPPIANVCLVAGQPMEVAVPIEILVAEPNTFENTLRYNPINGVSDSKFRNYFAKELHQMDRMGKQIKNLLQMTQRCNLVKPYLDEISNLQNSDHSKSDPHLDEDIDTCSGWNVEIELAKVHQEIHQLNKVLKTGLGAYGMASASSLKDSKHKGKNPFDAAANTRSSSYSSTVNKDSVTSDGGEDSCSTVDNNGSYFSSLSYAHTRHIPLLASGKSHIIPKKSLAGPTNPLSGRKPSSSTYQHPYFHSAKGSNSQPTISNSSSSSNNNSSSSIAFHDILTSSLNNVKPTITSHEKAGKDGLTNNFSIVAHYPDAFGSVNIQNFPTSSKSMEVFYKNFAERKGGPTRAAVESVWSYPSKSSTSSSSQTQSSSSSKTQLRSDGSNSRSLHYNDKGSSKHYYSKCAGKWGLSSRISEPSQSSSQPSSSGITPRVSESCTNFQINSHQHQRHHHRHPQKRF